MIWLICALLALVLLAFAARSFIKEKNSVTRGVIVLVCLFVATFTAYIPVFNASYGILPGLVGDLVHVLRMITIDADITQYYDVITQELQSSTLERLYILLLALMHILLPAVSALTAVTVLLRCFSSFRMFLANNRRRPVFIFSQANERSLHLAESLAGRKCDIVFADSSADDVNSENDARRGYIFKEEEISQIGVRSKGKKDIYFFCISEDEDVSLSHALQLMSRFSDASEAEQGHIHIYLFSQYQDYAVFVDSADKGMLDVQCINESEMLIYNLLNQHPLMNAESTGVHVLLHGFSFINMAALKAVAWCGQISGLSLRISVVGVDIGQNIEEIRLTVPGLFTDRYDIRFYDCENENQVVDTISEHCADANYIVVCEESDNLTMDRGILLRRLFYKLDPDFAACPPIFCYIKEPAKAQLLTQLATAESNPKRKTGYDLVPFGSLDEVFAYEKLVDSPLEHLAKNVHLAYEEIFSDGPIDVQEALKRYNVFEVNKRSNRANALHIRYKLRMLGLDYTEDRTVEGVRLEDFYTPESLQRMSVSEHDRWMAFLETEGWIPSTAEQVAAYRASGISKGRHNCPLLKMHPYICEYEKLKDLSLELENKDTTVYDEELIVRIPDILGDKWNHSGRKYNIIRIR